VRALSVDWVVMTRVDTVASISICILVAGVLLSVCICPLKRKVEQNSSIHQIPVPRSSISGCCLLPLPLF
uniref:Uncharacterized protein n=1 Tax=Spermophilus dauricus TaxID=99837 RepID=A0A8C9PDH1_SPEDA